MNELLLYMGNNQFANWVVQSTWVYPILLVLHATGLSLVVGFLCVIDLRILGVGRSLSLPGMHAFMPVVWLGLAVNVISGCMLLTADPARYYHSTTFRLKLLCIVLGLAATGMILTRVSANSTRPAEAGEPWRGRILAAYSLLCWLGAIVAGRLMAYTN